MTMLAVGAATQARKHKRGLLLGCAVMVGLPLALLGLLVVAVLVADDQADASGLRGVNCAPAESSVTQLGPYGPEQMDNAAAIVAVGRQREIPVQGVVVALMAAITESRLRNLPYGDRDSLGLFQMRPSQGWGTRKQVLNINYQVNKFYDVLLDVPDWQALRPGAAAQAVERSGFPDRYHKHEQTAREIFGAVSGVTCAQRPHQVSLPDNPRAEAVINAALSQLGVPYAWGGGTAQGPSMGTGGDDNVIGFDCSGLALYAYAQIGVAVPHQTQAIWVAFQPAITSLADIRPGDLILLSESGQPGGIHHVGIYLGGGKVVHAPRSGEVVTIVDRIWSSAYWSQQFIGAVRPGVV